VTSRLTLAFMLALLVPSSLHAQQQQQVTGIVLEVEPAHHKLVVSCDEIPGYMPAMEMPFTVLNAKQLTALHAGTPVRFTMLKRGHTLYARNIQTATGANMESEPMQADSLSTLQAALDPASAAHVVTQGQHVPDFELTDQSGNRVRLSSLSGKVVLITFGYSRCPNPDYCLRLSNNLDAVRHRLSARIPRDLVLLTIAIDPEHDQGAVLSQYAAVWKANPPDWYFLTGPLPQIKTVSATFGMNFWRREGLLTHTLHTVIIGRSGDLAAHLEGNQFTVQQLSDLVQSVINQRPQSPPLPTHPTLRRQ
jgi:protein SCO1